jgi:hypothetical protein
LTEPNASNPYQAPVDEPRSKEDAPAPTPQKIVDLDPQRNVLQIVGISICAGIGGWTGLFLGNFMLLFFVIGALLGAVIGLLISGVVLMLIPRRH